MKFRPFAHSRIPLKKQGKMGITIIIYKTQMYVKKHTLFRAIQKCLLLCKCNVALNNMGHHV